MEAVSQSYEKNYSWYDPSIRPLRVRMNNGSMKIFSFCVDSSFVGTLLEESVGTVLLRSGTPWFVLIFVFLPAMTLPRTNAFSVVIFQTFLSSDYPNRPLGNPAPPLSRDSIRCVPIFVHGRCRRCLKQYYMEL